MGIGLTDDHRELGEVVRALLERREARAAARAMLEAAEDSLPSFWPEIAELGWLGLHIHAEYGGSGYGLAELVVVVEEFGRAVAPGPFVPTVVASATVAACGTAAQRERLLPGLIDGSVTAGVGPAGDLEITADGRARGDAGVVLGAPTADLLLLGAGPDVLVVERTADGVTVSAPPNLDPTRRSGHVTLSEVRPLAVLPGARDTATAIARTLFAAEAVGGASDCVTDAVEYAKTRTQFGRTIATFQAVKHHCADMFVAAESAVATVWDAARAADDARSKAAAETQAVARSKAAARTPEAAQFQLIAAATAALAFPAYVRDAELNIQIHGGIGFTWEHDAHLHLRRALALRALFGGDAPAAQVYALTAAGTVRRNSLDLPAEAEVLRTGIRSDTERIAALDESDRHRELIATGYLMPHWPKPWGRSASAVEQLVIDEEMALAGVKRPDYSITGWVILTLIQHGTDDQIDRYVEKALLREEVWCQLFSEPEAGSDAAAVKTRAIRVDGGWRVTGQKVWTSGAHVASRGLATVRTDPDAPKHAGITAMIIDMRAEGVLVRPLRTLLGTSEFNEVFFQDVFVPDEDVVGTPNAGWRVARATLGNERVSIGGGSAAGSFAEDMLMPMAREHAHRLAGAEVRIGQFLADEHAVRLLELRRAVRSIEGAGPGPEGNITKLKQAQHWSEQTAIMSAITGPELALAEGQSAVVGMMTLGARAMSIAGGTSEITRNQIAERILGMPRDPLIT
ncbi:acyl-CoA dehydrogenase [Nocardia bovistercoris]|uniref:Acyl-CoA dehydrogenase family protein n=1 Tax=Nocardia bovistercoris TaxID=2785916 RepID=A0A931IAB8_9NOCA|nr:acyl-CoA dehydrogenase [Nocardia bovistercoris]MBH0776803.1 acyl-CoA dehydrogenase family protein [Nocardia bovistercoris]